MLFRRRSKQTVSQRLRNVLWPSGGPQRGWRYAAHRLRRIAASPHTIALGFATGAFVSFTPYVGFHFLLAAFITFFIGGSILASAIGTIVGNPLTYPFIWVLTYDVGGFLLGYQSREEVDLRLPNGMAQLFLADPAEFWRQFWSILEPVILPMSVGSIPLGLAAAVVSYFAVRSAVAGYRRRREARLATGEGQRERG